MNQYPKTLAILKRFITDRLARIYDSYEARSIAQQLLEDQFGVSLTDVLADKPLVLNKEQSEKLDQDLERLYQGEPIQYVTGKAHFFGRTFDVNRAVLIPRPETEELIQVILEENENLSSILDIGTGSGAIAITLKLEIVETSVTAVDLSTSALEVAKKNAKDLHAEVEFIEMDILKETPKGTFCAIVSNPPYVMQSEKPMMHKNVLDYEPATALFVADNQPLIFYERIAALGCEILEAKGKLYFEINERFGEEVKNMMIENGYIHVNVIKDMQGKDRMVIGERPNDQH